MVENVAIGLSVICEVFISSLKIVFFERKMTKDRSPIAKNMLERVQKDEGGQSKNNAATAL